MDEGKELLYKLIDFKEDNMSIVNQDDIVVDGINLVDIADTLEKDMDNLCDVPDSIIDKVIEDGKLDDVNLKKNLLQFRDLLIGKRNYNLYVKVSKEYQNAFDTFKTALLKIINKKSPHARDYVEVDKNLNQLKQGLENHKLIKNFDFIEELASEYNEKDFEANMLKIYKYINEHNLKILNPPDIEFEDFDIEIVEDIELSDQIYEILEKFDIDYRTLPDFLLKDLKETDPSLVYSTFETIKQNKAEDGGVLHLIPKENAILRVVLVLYSSPAAVKYVVDSLTTDDDGLDIESLKILLNYNMSIFIDRVNDFFKPKNDDYLNIMDALKEFNVNYKVLIKRDPLFLSQNYEMFKYTLEYCHEFGCNPKELINRCYKTLTINPTIIINNISVLLSHKVNMFNYFKSGKDDFNLLKVENLENILQQLITKKAIKKYSFTNYDTINGIIINSVFKKARKSVEE